MNRDNLVEPVGVGNPGQPMYHWSSTPPGYKIWVGDLPSDTLGSRKALARTNYARTLAAAACPIVVQEYSTWAARDSGATWDIYADGQPEALDALHLAPWAVLRAGLKHWQQAESDTQGCVSVTSATLASDLEWDIRGGPVPALALPETLGNQGWTRPPPGQPLP